MIQKHAWSSSGRVRRTPTEMPARWPWRLPSDILDQRASGQRLYRNMLVFLAPDLKRLEELERGSAEFLAWKEIEDRRAELNLDVFQTNQADSKRGDADRAVDLRLAETYHWCLVPDQPDPTGPIEWEMIKAEGQGSLGVRTSRKLVNAGSLGMAYASRAAPWTSQRRRRALVHVGRRIHDRERAVGRLRPIPIPATSEEPGHALRHGSGGSEPDLLADHGIRRGRCCRSENRPFRRR